MTWLFSGLAVAVVVLGAVAGRLWYKVWHLKRANRMALVEQEEARAENEQKRLDYIFESLNVIASAMLDDQCPVTEGCIRMAVLLDNLPLDCDTKHRFSPVFEIYNATRHIPTHSRWSALDRKQRQRYKQEMFSLENRHKDAIMDLLQQVKRKPFGPGAGLAIN